MAMSPKYRLLVDHPDPPIASVIRQSCDPRANHVRESMTDDLVGIIQAIKGKDITLSRFTPALCQKIRGHILKRPELVELVKIERKKLARKLAPGELRQIRDNILQRTKAAPVRRRLQWLENVESFVESLRKDRHEARVSSHANNITAHADAK